jgi:hypothetical protein
MNRCLLTKARAMRNFYCRDVKARTHACITPALRDKLAIDSQQSAQCCNGTRAIGGATAGYDDARGLTADAASGIVSTNFKCVAPSLAVASEGVNKGVAI